MARGIFILYCQRVSSRPSCQEEAFDVILFYCSNRDQQRNKGVFCVCSMSSVSVVMMIDDDLECLEVRGSTLSFSHSTYGLRLFGTGTVTAVR